MNAAQVQRHQKPETCAECGHFRYFMCRVGYSITEDSKTCRQAIAKIDVKKADYH